MTETPHRLSVRMSRRLVPRHEVAGLNPRKAFWNSLAALSMFLSPSFKYVFGLSFPAAVKRFELFCDSNPVGPLHTD